MSFSMRRANESRRATTNPTTTSNKENEMSLHEEERYGSKVLTLEKLLSVQCGIHPLSLQLDSAIEKFAIPYCWKQGPSSPT